MGGKFDQDFMTLLYPIVKIYFVLLEEVNLK